MFWPTLNFIVDKTCWNILQNIFFGVLQRKETHTGLQRHEGSKWWQKFHFCMNHPFKNKKWQTSPSRKYYLHHHQSHRHAIKAESRPSAAGSHEDPEGYVTGAVISDECWSVCVSRDVRSAASQQAWHNSIKVPQKQRKKECHFYLYQGGKQFSTLKSRRATFYTPWGKQMKPVVIIYGLFGGVSECGARSCLTVRYVWLNLSLTDAIFISRETVTSHLTTGIKIKHFFGGGRKPLPLSLLPSITQSSTAAHMLGRVLCFFFWIAIFCSLFMPQFHR